MSMRFNRFYNKLSKKNSKINIASIGDKLISSVPADELVLPDNYTIEDSKVYYKDTKIGDFSYRNIDNTSSIDLDDISIVSDKDDELDLDDINFVSDEDDSLDLDSINIIPTKAKSVPKTVIDDDIIDLNDVNITSHEKETFTKEEQRELLDKIYNVQEGLRNSFLEYESNKKHLTDDYIKQIEGYKTRFNDLQSEIIFESKEETEAQLNELSLMKKQVDNVNGRVKFKINNAKSEEDNKDVKKPISALDKMKAVKTEDKKQTDVEDREKALEKARKEKEEARLAENKVIKMKKAAIAKALAKDMMDIIAKQVAEIKKKQELSTAAKKDSKGNNILDRIKAKKETSKVAEPSITIPDFFRLPTDADLSDKKKADEDSKKELSTATSNGKVSNILDQIKVKKEAAKVVDSIKDKVSEPSITIPEFLKRPLENDLSDKKKIAEDKEKARIEKEEAEKAIKLEQAKKKAEDEARKQEIISVIRNDSDVDYETLNERIYNKYSIKDIKDLDEKYSNKIEKYNSKLDKTNSRIEKTDKKIVEKEVALALAIENSNVDNELVYRTEIKELKEKLEELKAKAEQLKGKIADKETTISSIKERFTAESIKVYEDNVAEELKIMQEKEDAMNARFEKEAIEERDINRKEISKVFRQDVAKEESALNFKTNNEIKKLLAYTKKLEAEGKDSKEFIKNYTAAIEAERKANAKLEELELAMGIVKDNKKAAKRR